jgi:hypothetical protein
MSDLIQKEERLSDNNIDFGILQANSKGNNKVNNEKAKPKTNINSYPTESSTRKTLSQHQKLAVEKCDTNSLIKNKNEDKNQSKNGSVKNSTSSQKLLQKKRNIKSLENKKINETNGGKNKIYFIETKKNGNNKIKRQNQEKEKEKGREFKMVNENIINTVNNNIINVGNNNGNNNNNRNSIIGNNNDNNINDKNYYKIDINEEKLLHRTEEYINSTLLFNPYEDNRNLKRLYDFCLLDGPNNDISYYWHLINLFKHN